MQKKQKKVGNRYISNGYQIEQQITGINKQDQKQDDINYENKVLYKKYSCQNIDRLGYNEMVYSGVRGWQMGYSGGVKEFQSYYLVREFVFSYMKLEQTKILVSNLMKKVAKEFRLPVLHFYQPIYTVLRKKDRYMLNSQKQRQNIGNQAKGTYSIIRQISNRPKLRGNKSRSEKKSIHGHYCIRSMNESFYFIRNLCKKIDSMCNNIGRVGFNGLIGNQLFYRKVEVIRSDKERKFREELQQNFSKIDRKGITGKEKKKSDKNKVGVIEKQLDDIYGLTNMRLKNREPLVKLKTESSTKRLPNTKDMTDSSPMSQTYYAKQYNFTECRKKIKSKKQRLLTSYSCKRLKGKSTDKANRNLQAYLKIFKSKSKSVKKELTKSTSQRLLKGVRKCKVERIH